MADIKTKDNAKGTIRTIDKAAVATQRMKQAYIATKEKAERSVNANSSSAEEYASDKLEILLLTSSFRYHRNSLFSFLLQFVQASVGQTYY